MLDKIGTLLGMLIGASLVIFGIIWPDHLSNYYMFKFREFEMGLEALKSAQASIEDIRALKADFKAFQASWLGRVREIFRGNKAEGLADRGRHASHGKQGGNRASWIRCKRRP